MKIQCCLCAASGDFSEGLSESEIWNYGSFYKWDEHTYTCADCTGDMFEFNKNMNTQMNTTGMNKNSVTSDGNFHFACKIEGNIK